MLKVAINTTILTLLHACRKHKNSSFFQIVFKSSSSVTDLHLTTNNKFWQGYNVSILPWPYNKSLSNDFKVDDDDFVFFISLFSCLYPSSLVYIPLFLFIFNIFCHFDKFIMLHMHDKLKNVFCCFIAKLDAKIQIPYKSLFTTMDKYSCNRF